MPADATGEEARLWRFFETQFAVFKWVALSALALQASKRKRKTRIFPSFNIPLARCSCVEADRDFAEE